MSDSDSARPPCIYHTCASLADYRRACEVAPELDHGIGWLPVKMCAHDTPYFLDNGCYRKWLEGDPPDPPSAFWDRLASIDERMPRDPDFVVLPDLPGTAQTLDHAGHYLRRVKSFGYPVYLCVHEGMPPRHQVSIAAKWGCAGVFLGGPMPWKREAAPATVTHAHAAGLRVHVGRPETAAAWFLEQGVDSLDTQAFVRHCAWDRLRRLAHSTTSETRQGTLTATAEPATMTATMPEPSVRVDDPE